MIMIIVFNMVITMMISRCRCGETAGPGHCQGCVCSHASGIIISVIITAIFITIITITIMAIIILAIMRQMRQMHHYWQISLL